MWHLETTISYERHKKFYSKKKKTAFECVMKNLGQYFDALNVVDNIKKINAGYIHPEGKGVIALSEKCGGKKQKVEATRLYIFPDEKNKILYLLGIGSKKRQSEDIIKMHQLVKKIERGEEI